MDKENAVDHHSGSVGVSLRNGPLDETTKGPSTNGTAHTNGTSNGKRKSRDGIRVQKSYKEESGSEDDDKPLVSEAIEGGEFLLIPHKLKRRKTSTIKKEDLSESSLPERNLPPELAKTKLAYSSDSDIPLGKKLSKKKKSFEHTAEKEAKGIRKDAKKQLNRNYDSEDDDDIPLSKKNRVSSSGKAKVNGVKEEKTKDVVLNSRKANSTKAAKVKSEKSTPVKKSSTAKVKEMTTEDKEAEEEEEEYRWWEDPTKGDGTIKWTTLEHNGVVFPPPYEPLPANVKMRYDGVPITLVPEAEEVATFYGSMLNSTVNVENPTFNKNFFSDFMEILNKTRHAKDKNGNTVKIKDFAKCDFKPIFEYFDGQRAAKKALPTAERKAMKAAKDEAEAPYMYCTWDGRKQKVGNFRVEPPGLFRGRGEHPKTGKVKKRVQPEQVTINVGKDAPVPVPPEGHTWKEIKHDQEGTWLAMWQENINGAYKYVMLAANSDVKGQSDHKKFEKARDLKVRKLKRFACYANDSRNTLIAFVKIIQKT